MGSPAASWRSLQIPLGEDTCTDVAMSTTAFAVSVSHNLRLVDNDVEAIALVCRDSV